MLRPSAAQVATLLRAADNRLFTLYRRTSTWRASRMANMNWSPACAMGMHCCRSACASPTHFHSKLSTIPSKSRFTWSKTLAGARSTRPATYFLSAEPMATARPR